MFTCGLKTSIFLLDFFFRDNYHRKSMQTYGAPNKVPYLFEWIDSRFVFSHWREICIRPLLEFGIHWFPFAYTVIHPSLRSEVLWKESLCLTPCFKA